MTPREAKQIRDEGFVDFMRKVGVIAGATLALVTLTSMVVKQTVTAGSAVLSGAVAKAVGGELRPIVERVESLEAHSIATTRALRYPVGSRERARILSVLDSLEMQSEFNAAARSGRQHLAP